MEGGGEGGDTGYIGTWVTSPPARQEAQRTRAVHQHRRGSHPPSSWGEPHTRRDHIARVLIKLHVNHNQYARFINPIFDNTLQ
jgi:hypothetical protein